MSDSALTRAERAARRGAAPAWQRELADAPDAFLTGAGRRGQAERAAAAAAEAERVALAAAAQREAEMLAAAAEQREAEHPPPLGDVVFLDPASFVRGSLRPRLPYLEPGYCVYRGIACMGPCRGPEHRRHTGSGQPGEHKYNAGGGCFFGH